MSFKRRRPSGPVLPQKFFRLLTEDGGYVEPKRKKIKLGRRELRKIARKEKKQKSLEHKKNYIARRNEIREQRELKRLEKARLKEEREKKKKADTKNKDKKEQDVNAADTKKETVEDTKKETVEDTKKETVENTKKEAVKDKKKKALKNKKKNALKNKKKKDVKGKKKKTVSFAEDSDLVNVAKGSMELEEEADDRLTKELEKKLGLEGDDFWKDEEFGEFAELLRPMESSPLGVDLRRPAPIRKVEETPVNVSSFLMSDSSDDSDSQGTSFDKASDVGVEPDDESSADEEAKQREAAETAKRRAEREAIYGKGVVHSDDEDEAEKTRPPLQIALLKTEKPVQVSEIFNKYVPPQLRKDLKQKDAKSARIKRAVRSSLNKLTQNNIETISREIFNLFTSHSYSECTKALMELIIDGYTGSLRILAGLVRANSALLSCLHFKFGATVGSAIMELLTLDFDRFYDEASQRPAHHPSHITAQNILLTFVHMYTFQMCSCKYVVSVAKRFVNSFKILDLELLWVLLTNCGYRLRKDDPVGLKEIIQTVIKNSGTQESPSKRSGFLVDFIKDLKNNKRSNKTIESAIQPLRNFLRGVRARNPGAVGTIELAITYEDIAQISEKGRWWLSGSAWTGGSTGKKLLATKSDKMDFSDDLINLAKKFKMNNELRRTIFCCVMGADDYQHSFERIVRLGLKGSLDREVARIILLCAQSEKSYNPFYSLLLNRLMEFQSSYRFTTQLMLWDKYKAVDKLTDQQISNIARLMGFVIAKSRVPLTALKVIEFVGPSMKQTLFTFLCLREILMLATPDSIEQLAKRLVGREDAVSEDLREGILVFLDSMVKPRLGNNRRLKENFSLLAHNLQP